MPILVYSSFTKMNLIKKQCANSLLTAFSNNILKKSQNICLPFYFFDTTDKKKMKNKVKEIKQELKKLYKYFPEVRKLLKSFGCNKSLAEDIFQEALIIYLRKKADETFQFQLEPIHFIKQTCKFLWMNEARKQQKEDTIVLNQDFKDRVGDWMEKELKLRQLEDLFSKIGEQRKQLLQLFYGLEWSMNEIAKQMGFRNEKVVKTVKYRCVQKAKNLVKEGMLNVEPIK